MENEKMKQLERYIDELQEKNKTLMMRCITLHNENRELGSKTNNLEKMVGLLDNKSTNEASVGKVKQTVKPATPKEFVKPGSANASKKMIFKEIRKKSLVKVTTPLTTEELVALWNKISAIPLPQCQCSKRAAKRRVHLRTKKFKAA